ncbi:MAG: TetR/AcrR family transcriptional regulator [Burkholderiales bacterium]|jgi:AcrR family transcriptional regulator|nr:TetR/AcrR family transcriptional regulator [Burkholderiales bacterium]
MARPRAATFDQQREAILDAAATLFARRGYASASMAELAEACGISKPLLYHYYRDKEHILFDIVDGHMERLLAVAAAEAPAVLAPAGSVDAATAQRTLRTLVRRFMDEYEHAQDRHVVLVQDVKFLSEARRVQVVAKQRRVVDAFARTVVAVRPRRDDAVYRVPLAMILFGMINWTFTWLRPDGPLDHADVAEVVADVFLHGVAGD